LTYTPISVIVPCFNEEDNIADCLLCLLWADEILLIDSYSTDKTLEIAKKFTNRIMQREYKSHGDQLNWAIPYASHDWVLIVDTDERIPDSLSAEIRGLNLADTSFDGFYIKRANHLFGKRMNFSGWGRDVVMRLFKRDVGRKEKKRVHADFKVSRPGHLKQPLQHYPVKSVEDWVEKINRYTSWKALDKVEKGSLPALVHLCIRPPFRFAKDAFLRFGFLDGWRGVLVAAMSAFAEMVMAAKMLQLQIPKKNLQDLPDHN
jgi:glycosyltransferase involved in cell wall biosynthesis